MVRQYITANIDTVAITTSNHPCPLPAASSDPPPHPKAALSHHPIQYVDVDGCPCSLSPNEDDDRSISKYTILSLSNPSLPPSPYPLPASNFLPPSPPPFPLTSLLATLSPPPPPLPSPPPSCCRSQSRLLATFRALVRAKRAEIYIIASVIVYIKSSASEAMRGAIRKFAGVKTIL